MCMDTQKSEILRSSALFLKGFSPGSYSRSGHPMIMGLRGCRQAPQLCAIF